MPTRATSPRALRSPRLEALKFGLVYLVLGTAWVFATDALLARLPLGHREIELYHSAKAFLFVAATSLLAFAMARRLLHKVEQLSGEVREHEARLDAVFACAGDGIIATDVESRRVVVSNPALEEMLGYSSGELSRLTVDALHPSEDAGFLVAQLERIERGELTQVRGVRFKRKDGSFFFADVNGSPLRLGGRPCLMGIVHDTSEQRRVEEALRESERRLATIFQVARAGIQVTRVGDGRILDLNEQWSAGFGWSREEAVGRTTGELQLYSDPSQREALLQRVRDDGGMPPTELRIRRKSGEPGTFLLSAGPGEIAGERCVIGVWHDLTELREKDEALRESERRLRETLDGLIEGCLILDRDWRYLYVNEAAARQRRMTPEQLIGRTPFELFPGFRESELFAAGQACMERGESCRLEAEFPLPDGSRPWLDISIQPSAEGIVLLTLDNSTRRQAELARTRVEEQLRQAQKMEAVGRLAGGVAHDFNNLLSVIISYGGIVEAALPPESASRDDLGEIVKAGKRAAELTRQLLLFSRQQILAPKVLDLNEVVANTEKMIRRIVGEDVALVVVRAPALGAVRADPGSIEQVLMNLVVNARDAMPTGGRLTITTENVAPVSDEDAGPAARQGPQVMLIVADTGVGMDRVTQERMFEPFFTTKEVGKGTGLGLSTVFGIVQQHGGAISVESAPGRGSTFRICFPRLDAAAEAPAPAPAAGSLDGRETILLVEDERQVRNVAHAILQRRGYRVLLAESAGEALLLSEQYGEPIDLLLSDVVMPQLGGAELGRRLLCARPAMKQLFMSGYTDDSAARHGILEGKVAFLQKPFTPDSLALKVREVLQAG